MIIDQWRVENSVNNNHKILIAIAGVALVGFIIWYNTPFQQCVRAHPSPSAPIYCLKLQGGG